MRPILFAFLSLCSCVSEDFGALGKPRAGLSESELQAFYRGKALFERRFTITEGVGPYYNDVSCASCHAIPTVGGAGDANHVARLGPDPDHAADIASFRSHAAPGFPPHVVPANASVRFTPPLYGIGAFDGVTDAEIDNGCTGGHAAFDESRRILRFGFKPFAPTVRQFVRAAFDGEMGLTSPGADHAQDADAVPDPEITDGIVDDVTAYIKGLAAPEPTPGAAGGNDFYSIGCASCHRPDRGHTDLCVHDLGPALDDGIQDHNTIGREWRTAPLWGVKWKARWLRDGRAASIDEAIRLHSGEAESAKNAYVNDSRARASVLEYVNGL